MVMETKFKQKLWLDKQGENSVTSFCDTRQAFRDLNGSKKTKNFIK